MSEPVWGVVCDAGPLIHLDELGSLSLLADFAHILVPEQVWQEVEVHRPNALPRSGLSLQKVAVSVSTQAAFQTLAQALLLGHGEQAALSLMADYPQAIFLTDDAAARLAAVTLGYRVHGTIGILLRSVRRGQQTGREILAVLRKLPTQSTLYVRPNLLQEIIDQLERQ